MRSTSLFLRSSLASGSEILEGENKGYTQSLDMLHAVLARKLPAHHSEPDQHSYMFGHILSS